MIGFDVERHVYGEHRYPATLVLQDVLTVHGAQFRDATLIVASPPCQEFSYMAMPGSLAKAKAAAIRADTTGQMLADLTRLFDACFRIQREACEAAGRAYPPDRRTFAARRSGLARREPITEATFCGETRRCLR